jgi:hypothetical protein
VVFRPEQVLVEPDDDGDPGEETENVLRATIARSVFYGQYLHVEIDVDGVPLRAHVHPSLELRRGDRVRLRIPRRHLRVLPQDDGPERAPMTAGLDDLPDEVDMDALVAVRTGQR